MKAVTPNSLADRKQYCMITPVLISIFATKTTCSVRRAPCQDAGGKATLPEYSGVRKVTAKFGKHEKR